MINKKFLAAAAFFMALIVSLPAGSLAFGKKKQANFKVRIENIAAPDGLAAENGTKYPFAVSPGLYILTGGKTDFFKTGKKAGAALEAQSEDGDPEALAKKLLTRIGSVNIGIFNKPVGGREIAPILPGGAYEFTFTAVEGTKLNLIAMYGQSNDLFYAPETALDLFVGGEAVTGDITDKFLLWDAGTEVNQAPGIGDEQAPRQKAPNTGKAENGTVGPVRDGFSYPSIRDVLRITISLE